MEERAGGSVSGSHGAGVPGNQGGLAPLPPVSPAAEGGALWALFAFGNN